SKGFTWETGPGTYNLIIGAYSDQVAFVSEATESFNILKYEVAPATVTKTVVETTSILSTVSIVSTIAATPVEAIGIFAVILIVAVALTAILSRRMKLTGTSK
ncbi:MAG: hypothetical protein QXH15_06330, partial [Nitrososphaerota archaeon]